MKLIKILSLPFLIFIFLCIYYFYIISENRSFICYSAKFKSPNDFVCILTLKDLEKSKLIDETLTNFPHKKIVKFEFHGDIITVERLNKHSYRVTDKLGSYTARKYNLK
jgi:hypothetical protein